MVQEQGGSDFFSVPVEASVFLAAVSAFAIFLLVIFMYVNKKWRLLDVSIGDEDQTLPGTTQPFPLNVKLRNQLDEFNTRLPHQGTLYPEDDIMRRSRYPSSQSIYQNRPTLLSNTMRGYSLDQSSSTSSPNHHNNPSHFKRMHVQHRSLDLGPSKSAEFTRYSPDFSQRQMRQQQFQQQQQQQQHLIVTNGEIPQDTGRSTHFTGSMSLRPLRVTMIRDIDGGGTTTSRRRTRHQKGMTRSNTGEGRTDMMSLAEKGKVCGGSSASSTSSNVSADDVDVHGHRHGVINCQLSPSKSQPLSMGSQLNAARMSRHSKVPRNIGDHNPPCRQHPITIPSNVTNSSSISSSNINSRRTLVKQPRTNSMDSETPPTSEAGTSIYADEDSQIFEDDEMMSTVEGNELGMIVRTNRDNVTSSRHRQYGRLDVAFDSEDQSSSSVKMTPRSLQALGVLSKEIGAANGTQVRILLLPKGKQKLRTRVSSGESPQASDNFVLNKINPAGSVGEGRTTPSRYGNACADDEYTPMLQTSI